MPNWKKVIVSGSDAALRTLNVTTAFTASGLNYPTTDNGEESFLQTNGSGILSFQYVKTIYEEIYNGEATQILKGTPLYVSGAVGAASVVYRADAGNAFKMPVIYISADNIASGATGRGIALGLITGVDTTGYPPGTEIYVAVGGGWTSTRPTGSAIVQTLGYVTKEGAGGQGVILNPGPNSLPNLPSGSVWVGNSSSIPTSVLTSSLSVASASFASTSSFTTAVSGTTNYVSKFTGTNTLGNSQIFDNGTNVGIGTTSTTSRLEVVPTANQTSLTLSGYSLTGANAQPALDISGTWNTTGTPTLIRANVTNTASNVNSLLMDLQVGGSSQFRVTRSGHGIISSLGTNINILSGNWYLRSIPSGMSSGTEIGISFTQVINGTGGSARGFDSYTSFSPSSGNLTWTSYSTSPIINQTGGANGITRGLYVNPTLTSAADWRSIEWSNSSGWGLYGAGTSPNYFNGSITIGNTTNPVGTTLAVRRSLDATRISSVISDVAVLSGANLVYGYRSRMFTSTGTYTVGTGYHFSAEVTSPDTNSSFTNQIGFYASPSMTGATNNYGFYGDIPSGTGRWNLYMNGTANNYINGRTLLGTTTDNGTDRLQVNGSTAINGNTTITGSLAVSQSLLQYSNITSVTSGSTSNVASFNTSSYTAAFFDYVTTSGTSARAGTVFTVWNGNNVEYTETSTNDIGNTNNLVLSASLSAGAIRLQATSLSGSWSVKTLARMI